MEAWEYGETHGYTVDTRPRLTPEPYMGPRIALGTQVLIGAQGTQGPRVLTGRNPGFLREQAEVDLSPRPCMIFKHTYW